MKKEEIPKRKDKWVITFSVAVLAIIIIVGSMYVYGEIQRTATVTGILVSGYNIDNGEIVFTEGGRTGGPYTVLNLTNYTISHSSEFIPLTKDGSFVFASFYDISHLVEGKNYSIEYKQEGTVNTAWYTIKSIKEV